MAYNVNSYFIFLPTVALLYQLVKKERRWWVLLGASVVFFWLISRQLILWAVVTAGITYSIAGWIDRTQVQIKAIDRSEKERRNALKEKSRKILQIGLLGTVGILVALKYTAFTVETTMQVVRHFGGNGNFSVGRILVPIGISFYTLQAVSYLLDVYWKREKAESNFFKLFLFLIFFPTVMEGPILQWSDTKDTLYSGEPIQGENLGLGCFRIIWGLFKRMIVSDRLNTAVLMLYRPEAHYSGFMIVLTAVITTIQLYLEFSGTIDIVIGSARIFGVKLPENFRQPFKAKSAAEFWRRWHITLGRWFKNYIFYPVTTSSLVKKWGKYGRKHCGKYITMVVTSAMALFPVWMLNGLWHGPKWPYILYGVYYFIILLVEVALEPLGEKMRRLIHVSDDNPIIQKWHMVRTWVIIVMGEMLFRAESFGQFLSMCRNMFRGPFISDNLATSMLSLKLDPGDWFVVIVGTVLVFIVDDLLEKKPDLFERFPKIPTFWRWSVYYGLIVFIIVFGAYGAGYQTVDLIYAGF